MVGHIGIKPYDDEQVCGNLEFHVFEEFRRNHYCTEALTVFIDAIFAGMFTPASGETIVADTMKENEPSWMLLESLGFERISWGARVSLAEGGELDKDSCFT